MTRWLSVVGLGEDGYAALAPAAQAIVTTAEVVVGGARHFALADAGIEGNAERVTWRRPLVDTMNDIRAHEGKRVVVLATGDPMAFGIGVTLARHFSHDEMLMLPAPSAFSLACARLGWPATQVDCITLHGRPLETLRPHLAPGNRVLALSDDGTTPAKVAAELVALGYSESEMTVFEHMGGEQENSLRHTASTWPAEPVADLNTIAIECTGSDRTKRFMGGPGLPDRAFENTGQLTKREVRAVTLAALRPTPGALLWDIGAGAGSVGIEWLLAHPTTEAIALERKPEGCAMIARNAAALGVPRLKVEQGRAPEALELLPSPDAAFVGGAVSVPGVLETCWARLKPGGRLVANAVTTGGEAALARFHDENGGRMCRIAISRVGEMGQHAGWRAMTPVTQLEAIRP